MADKYSDYAKNISGYWMYPGIIYLKSYRANKQKVRKMLVWSGKTNYNNIYILYIKEEKKKKKKADKV